MANKYSKDIFDFISKNVKGKSNIELLEIVNKKFNNLFTLQKLKAYKKNNHLSSGLTGKFKKGHIPQNKGQKMSPEHYKKCSGTMFKKGHCPHNHKPVGSERVENKDNMILIKVAEPNKWMYKQRYIWEQVTGEKVPKESIVTFLDGNNRNFDISNLACITKNENCRLNKNKMRSNSADITKVNISLVRLDNKLRELKQ